MLNVSLSEFKKKVELYLNKVKKGDVIIIKDKDETIAQIEPANNILSKKRPIGLAKGDFAVPDDFDSPLPKEIIQLFEK